MERLMIFLLRMKLFFDLLIPQTDIVSQAEFSYLFPSKEYQYFSRTNFTVNRNKKHFYILYL